MLFDLDYKDHEGVLSRSYRLKEVMRCGTNSLNSITRRGDRRVEKWERPEDGRYKVNSNGALRAGNGMGASGGAWQMGGRRMVLDIDSAIAVQMLLGCEAGKWSLRLLLLDNCHWLDSQM
ncbi:hypothetical protein J1N35_024758 [Gossypium stocksii]|uniref:Uncharacterized protein n=1 Tax=Gossypium stocksii TaxID=47602 RepID=A0A9D3V595_9ROSI|nr:hypothetical protein J1N35_024758 [Gossypium stocksii]